MSNTIDRRSLLTGAVTTAVAASATARAASPNDRWDHEVDVLIVGFGLAACSAAIEALDTDPNAKILMLEKPDAANAGGDTRASGQSLAVPKSKEGMMNYYRNLSGPNPIPEDVLEFYVDELLKLHPWIEARAKEADQHYIQKHAMYEFPELGAKDALFREATILPRHGGLWEAFKKNIVKRPIDVWYESPAVDLVQDCDTGEVFGAVVNRKGKTMRVKARRGVVLACGGYAANPDMLANFCGYMDTPHAGSPYNTGDGIRMLQKAGAHLWHMRNPLNSSGMYVGIQVPEFTSDHEATGFFRTAPRAYSWIEIAADNRRFYDEAIVWGTRHWHTKSHGNYVDQKHQWVQPVHMIFDETVRTTYSLVNSPGAGWNNVVRGYRWSKDNSVEIEKGWILKANSIGELAEKMGRDREAVEAEVAEFNKACEAGKDPKFDRDPQTMKPIVKAPFYAVRVRPMLICTSGGAKRTPKSEVLSYEGKPIPGLYSAGQLGSMISFLYQNGSYLTEAMITGRSAGRNAALRKART